jgi:hypothetical protein
MAAQMRSPGLMLVRSKGSVGGIGSNGSWFEKA